jgi:hypothetical protein
MASTIPREDIGGEGVHVRDCYVWMDICYLDSPSDFREYLPQDRREPNNEGLVILDSSRRSAVEFCGPLIGDAVAGLVVVAILILTIFFFYTLVDL